MDDSIRGDQRFSSSNIKAQNGKNQSIKPQSIKGQSAKLRIEMNEISARAFGQFQQRGEEIRILRWDEVNNEIQLEAINISIELAIKNERNKKTRTPGRSYLENTTT